MRIAMVLNFPRQYQDAVSRFSQCLLGALSKDFRVEAISIAPAGFGAAPGRPALQLLVALQQLVQLIARQPATVHVHEHPVALAAAVTYRLLTLGTTRLVYTVHVQPVQRRSYWKRAVLGWLLQRCTVVTAVSADTARRLDDIATPRPRRISVIHGGAEIQARAPGDAALLQFRSRFGVQQGPVLSQIGLNYPLKVAGVLLLMQAVKLVRLEFPNIRLLLIGEGPLRASVAEAIVQMDLTDSVILTGYQHDISLPLSAADIYCHITLQDAAPLSLLEAMSCGKPIVAARTGGIPELVVDGVTAILVDAESEQIARVLLQLLRHPEHAQQLGANALQAAASRYTWHRVAQEFAVAYGVPSNSQ